MVDAVLAQVSPLCAELSGASLQSCDVVGTWVAQSGDGERQEDEAAVLAEALETRQLLLEKLFDLAARGDACRADLEQLQRARDESANNLRQNVDETTVLKDTVAIKAHRVCTLVDTYEEHRVTLKSLLNQLLPFAQEELPQGIENMNIEDCEAQLEKEIAEMQRLNEQQKRLHDICCEHSEKTKRSHEELGVLAERTHDVEAALKAMEEHDEDDHMSQVIEKLDWVTQIQTVLSNLTGIVVRDFTQSSFIVKSSLLESEILLEFNPETSALTDATVKSTGNTEKRGPQPLVAARISFLKKLVAEAVKRNDVQFLVRELRASICNKIELDREIENLSKTYPVAVADSEIIITLPIGIVATFQIGICYPERHASAMLRTLEAFNGWKQNVMKEMEDYLRKLQDEQKTSVGVNLHRISGLLQAIDARVKSLQTE